MNFGGDGEATHLTAGLISGSADIRGLRWRAGSYGDTNSDPATESYGIRHEDPYVDGHTNRYAGAANTSGSNANCRAHAHADTHRDSKTDRDTSARVA